MLKVNPEQLQQLEASHPGVMRTILYFERQKLPACPHCGSPDAADVNVGIIGRTIAIAAATTKFALIPNGPKAGAYRCNACRRYFDSPTTPPASGPT